MLRSKKSKLFVLTSAMALSGMLSGIVMPVGPMNVVMAAELAADGTSYVTEDGAVEFDRGIANVTIVGNSGQTLIGKKFNIYKLFNAENSKNEESINYTFNPECEQALKNVVSRRLSEKGTAVEPNDVTEYMVIDYIQSLNSHYIEGATAEQVKEGSYSDFRYFVEDIRTEMENLDVKPTVVSVRDTKADNSVVVSGLEYGYYVIDEVSAVDGTHSASSLCMVDTLNAAATIKVKSDYPTVSKKIQEDDANDAIADPDRWNDIADYEIGQTVNYKNDSTIPNMNGYDTYYYAWHDKMDKALTFDPASVSVSITGTTADGTEKTYTLAADEYEVVTTGLAEGETFNVVCQDIKNIVDREFDQMNSDGENVYGQKVRLSYSAVLNDDAADKTGRPGFENDVRLEFSNDADSDGEGRTGFTPWDTVVCFTYKLDVQKINDHQEILSGAKFRLYSDKNCENEVYVKEAENGSGYIVINRDSLGGTDHEGGDEPADAVEMVSAEDGTFMIYGLDSGKYYLKETEAPDGYRLLKDAIVLDVMPTFTEDRDDYVKGDGATEKTLQKLEAKAKIDSFYNGIFNTENQDLDTDVADGSMNLTVVNKVGSKLPVTGTPAVMLMFIAGSALMAGAVAYNKKKED